MEKCEYPSKIIVEIAAPMRQKSAVLLREALINDLKATQIEATLREEGYGAIGMSCDELAKVAGRSGDSLLMEQAKHSAYSEAHDIPLSGIEENIAKMWLLALDKEGKKLSPEGRYILMSTDLDTQLGALHKGIQERIGQYP